MIAVTGADGVAGTWGTDGVDGVVPFSHTVNAAVTGRWSLYPPDEWCVPETRHLLGTCRPSPARSEERRNGARNTLKVASS